MGQESTCVELVSVASGIGTPEKMSGLREVTDPLTMPPHVLIRPELLEALQHWGH